MTRNGVNLAALAGAEGYPDDDRDAWQAAVDLARALIIIELARRDGSLDGGPPCDVRRCEEIIRRGAARGVKPNDVSALNIAADMFVDESVAP